MSIAAVCVLFLIYASHYTTCYSMMKRRNVEISWKWMDLLAAPMMHRQIKDLWGPEDDVYI